MPYTFRIKFTQEEIQNILLRHLINEGQIGDEEAKLCKGMSKFGKAHLMEFEVITEDYVKGKSTDKE